MATTVSTLPVREDSTFLPLGTLLDGLLLQVRSKMDARKAEEARLWDGYCTNGKDWLIANTEPVDENDDKAAW